MTPTLPRIPPYHVTFDQARAFVVDFGKVKQATNGDWWCILPNPYVSGRTPWKSFGSTKDDAIRDMACALLQGRVDVENLRRLHAKGII